MCEVESTGTTGNGLASSVKRLSISCPEDITMTTKNYIEEKTREEGQTVIQQDITSEDLGVRRGSVGTRDPSGVSESSMDDKRAQVEGVDPFSPVEDSKKEKEEISDNHLLQPSSPLGTPKERERRGSKTVNFKEPEIEEVNENGTTNEVFLTSSTSSNGSHKEDGAVGKKPLAKQRSLGETNPVYRLSMKLSPNLFNIQEIPGASQHREVEKVGFLTKLSGRSFPYIPQWKRRYCVLSKGRLYYYEREDSKAGDKSNGVINLEYFDQVTEATPKDCKKATNVFIITSQDRSFFDPGRHLFSADTLPDMKDWVRKLQTALEQIRNNNRPATSSTASSKKDGGSGKKGKEGVENKENKENAQNSTKDRKKKKDSHRSRKSARVADGLEVPSQITDSSTLATPQREAEATMTSSVVGIQLPGMASQRGIQLPGMSAKKEVVPQENKEKKSDVNQQNEDGLPSAGPTLNSVTKLRVKGPQGRRVPQNHRRTMGAAALKKRASSLSALEYQDLNDTRSESSQSTRDSSRNSKTPENDLDVVEESPSMHETIFEDIDKDLFFSKKISINDANNKEGKGAGSHETNTAERESKLETESSTNIEVNSGEKSERISRLPSRSSSILGSKLSRFRESMMTMKRRRFETKDFAVSEHPDEIDRSSWTCNIL